MTSLPMHFFSRNLPHSSLIHAMLLGAAEMVRELFEWENNRATLILVKPWFWRRPLAIFYMYSLLYLKYNEIVKNMWKHHGFPETIRLHWTNHRLRARSIEPPSSQWWADWLVTGGASGRRLGHCVGARSKCTIGCWWLLMVVENHHFYKLSCPENGQLSEWLC